MVAWHFLRRGARAASGFATRWESAMSRKANKFRCMVAGRVGVLLFVLSLHTEGLCEAEADGGEKPSKDAAEQSQAGGEVREKSEWRPPRFKEMQVQRDAMVRVIRRFYRLDDEKVLAAMAAVPRHEFVPRTSRFEAHADTPLPIGHGQTISQPYMVAEMTRLLQLTPDSKVLEVGTGSGYQAALLTEFTTHVYSVEIVEPLAVAARERLKRLGYDVVELANLDGYHGWPEEAPFDAIIVTCAAGQIPPPLLKQLKPGGRMVIPVGPVFATQSLMLIDKDEEGKIHSCDLMPVRFVPLVDKKGAAR